jgi:hypothetical protein
MVKRLVFGFKSNSDTYANPNSYTNNWLIERGG